MTRVEFVAGFEKLRVSINGKPKVVGYIKGNTFRSLLTDFGRHALHNREGHPPAIAKDLWILRYHVIPCCDWWEVYDEKRGRILRTTLTNFLKYSEEWKVEGYSVQLLLEEPFWEIEQVNEPVEAQAKLL